MRCSELLRVNVAVVEAGADDVDVIVTLRCMCVSLTEREKLRLVYL